MAIQSTFLMMVTMVVASLPTASTVAIQAAVTLKGEHSEFLQALFKQMDMLVSIEQQDSKVISQCPHGQASSEVSQAHPTVTIRGNVTDPERRLTITFTLQASRALPHYSPSALDDDDEDDEEEEEWHSSTGVLTPIVDVVEPYFLSFAELVFNGILSAVISNFLEGSNLLGDVRLV